VAPEKVQRIFNAYHGPDPESVTQSPREARVELGLEPEARYVLTICRLMVWKGVDGILRAVSQLPADVQLLIAGDGDMEQPWKALAAELGIAGRVRFLGNVPHARIPLLIRAADVFVLNSRYEGLSHTLLEVQALGTAIVASDVCGNPEVVEDGVNGLLVPPREVGALRGAIRKLLENKDLRASFEAEGRRRSRLFSRTATFSEVEAALERVARG
jgi:glycosyltransferase involved in cell wall biosynthesis